LTPGFLPRAGDGKSQDKRQLTPSIFLPSMYRVTLQQITSPAADNCAT
jgi:hypothetical protein